MLAAMLPPRLRTMRQFAEEEIILPKGPRAGMRFRCDYMPWTALALDVMDSGDFRRFVASGPAQSGKTVLFFIIPAMYHLFERGEDVIVGVPKLELAQAIYDERVKPAILRSRYADQLPRKGAGSRGGKFEAVQFENGAILRFMGAGGSDAQVSSHTSRIIILTEIDKMDTASAASREADPITQMETRSTAFGDQARLYAECTMSIETGRVYREVTEYGTDTKVYLPCAGCGDYVFCDRDAFTGWQGAEDLVAARERAGWACPSCGSVWTEEDRQASLLRPVLAGKGQRITKKGKVTGDLPRTNTWGFSWNSMHSAMSKMSDIAEREYRADQADTDASTREMLQFVWALPYRGDTLDLSGLTREIVLDQIGRFPRGIAPKGAGVITVFIDLGKYWCWWSAFAWKAEAVGYCIDYGDLGVPSRRTDTSEVTEMAMLNTLRTFRDDVLNHGWGVETDPEERLKPRVVMIDAGWKSDVAYRFASESGKQYIASKGLGSARNQGAWRDPAKGKGRQLGHNWFIQKQPNGQRLVNLNSDYWKAITHEGFAAPPGAAGSLQIFNAERRDHLIYAKQICAEQQVEEFVPGKGMSMFWNKLTVDNHYLDCAYGCRAAADMAGVKLIGVPRAKKPTGIEGKPAGGAGSIRTKY